MFEENPKIDLFPICFKYFQGVKSDMNYNEEVFNQWLKIQKLKYPHRLTYQRMKPEDFPWDPLEGIRMWSRTNMQITNYIHLVISCDRLSFLLKRHFPFYLFKPHPINNVEVFIGAPTCWFLPIFRFHRGTLIFL